MVGPDSPLLEIEHLREREILPIYTTVIIFVANPGNLSDPNRFDLLNQMVNELETMPESWGPNSTFLFYRDFLSFEQNSNMLDEESEITTSSPFKSDDLPLFLQWPEFSYWKGFVKTRKVG
jgi:hypothetical protein